VDGVDESHIEEDLSGTTVGGVRNFAMGGFRTRQRLLAHSDVDRFFTYVVTQSRSKQMALLELLSTTRAP